MAGNEHVFHNRNCEETYATSAGKQRNKQTVVGKAGCYTRSLQRNGGIPAGRAFVCGKDNQAKGNPFNGKYRKKISQVPSKFKNALPDEGESPCNKLKIWKKKVILLSSKTPIRCGSKFHAKNMTRVRNSLTD
jgi:hypothetical protein